MLPSQYFEADELLWYVNHVLERSQTSVRVSAFEAESSFDIRFSASTSQGKATAAIVEYQWHRSEGVMQIGKLWKMHNPALPYDYERNGKDEKNLLLLKGWGLSAPVITPARSKVLEAIDRREFRNDHEGKIRARTIELVLENRDYDDVATIALKGYAEHKHDVIPFEAVGEPRFGR